MGCQTSKEDAAEDKVHDIHIENSVSEAGNGSDPLVETERPSIKLLEKTNQIDTPATKIESSSNLDQQSAEILETKKEKQRTSSLAKGNSSKAERKSKELNKVIAWGKKTVTTEKRFLEDLKLHGTTSVKDAEYEKEYETIGADETSTFIEGMDNEDLADSSLSDMSDNLPHQAVQPRRSEQEESFDPSKIIDVEKFRAANVTEKRQVLNNEQCNKINGSEVDFSIQTKSSQEEHQLNSSYQYASAVKKEESFSGLYNEDDKDLIESIEKEFLTHDSYLPGQLIN